MPIKCFEIHGRDDLQLIFDNTYKEGMSEKELARKIIIEENEKLHNDMETLRKEVFGKSFKAEKFTAEDNTEKIKQLEKERDDKLAELEKEISKPPPPTEPPKEGKPTIFAERPGTELSHRGLQNTANEFSLEDVKVRDTKTDIELRQEARETVDGWAEKGQYATKVEGLIKKAEGGEILTDKERVILEGHLANLSAEAREVRKKHGLLSKEYDVKLAEVKRLKDAGEKTRSEAGAALRIPTFNSRPQTVEDALILEQEALGVGELTDKQKETVVKEFEDLEKAKNDFNAYVFEKEAEVSAKMAALKIAEQNTSTTKTRKADKDFSEERKQIITDIKDKLKKARQDTQVTILPYAKELIAIAPDVAKLVKNLVDNGVTKLADIVDRVHEILSDEIKDITKKDVNDLIAGVYTEKKQTRNEKARDLYNLKREAQLLNEYDKLESGEEPAREKDKTKRNQKLEALRKQIKEHDLTKLSEAKSRIEANIIKLESQIQKGDYSKEEKRQPIKLDKEGHQLRDKLMKLQQQRDARLLLQQRQNETDGQRALRRVAEVFNIPRTLMTIGDFSGLLRQNLFFSVGHPKITAQAIPGMFKAFTSQKVYDRWFADLKDTPRYSVIEKSRLAIADSLNHDLSKREEDFMSTLAEKIPLGIGKIVKGSERSYTLLLNKVRVDMFNYFADQMEARGLTFDNSPKEYKAMAEYINNATGRSDFGETLNRVAPILNATFFSPRLIASRMNMLTYWAQPRFWKTLPKEARIDYFRNWGSLLAVGGTILALASLGGADVEDDPRSSDFGKIKSGDTRWDIWGGAQPYVRTFAQILTGQRKSTNSGKVYDLDGEDVFGKTRADVVTTFFRNKLAPVPAAAVDVLSGRTSIGDKLVYQWGGAEDKEITIGEYVKDRLLPMTITGTEEAIKHDGLKTLLTVGVPSTFGIGTQTYSQPKTKEKTFTIKHPTTFKERPLTEQENLKRKTDIETETKKFIGEYDSQNKSIWKDVNNKIHITKEGGNTTKAEESTWTLININKLSEEQRKDFEEKAKNKISAQVTKKIKY